MSDDTAKYVGTLVDGAARSLTGAPLGTDPLAALAFVGALGMATWVLLLLEVEVGARTNYSSRVAALLDDPTGRGRAALAAIQCWPVPPTLIALLF